MESSRQMITRISFSSQPRIAVCQRFTRNCTTDLNHASAFLSGSKYNATASLIVVDNMVYPPTAHTLRGMRGLAKVSHLSPSPASIHLESVLMQTVHDSVVQTRKHLGVTAAKVTCRITLDWRPPEALTFHTDLRQIW